MLDEFVDLLDGLCETSHHVFGRDLQLVDEAVHLVDEQHRLHLLLQSLANHRFGLWHWPFNRTSKNETTVNSTHGTCDVATKVNVTWRVDEVDEVVRAFHGVDHRGGGSVDGDSTSGFLLVKVEHTCCTSEFVGHHSSTCDEVV